MNVVRLAVASLLLAFLAQSMEACIWISGTTKEGERISVSGLSPIRRLKNSLKTAAAAYAKEHDVASLGSTAIERRNNMAVDLILRSEARKAIEELKELEAEQPGDYITAANLGTAYELAGDNEQAWKWITEAIRRNPDSHYGTEWLHVSILEAKIKSAADPLYFQNYSVLNLDHRQIASKDSELQAGGARRRVRDIINALNYQLEERLRFVKANDPAVASLLYDYGVIEAGTGTLETAVELLKMAATFGYPATRIEPLVKQYERTIFMATLTQWLMYGATAFAAIALLIYARHRGWIFASRRRLASRPA
jgi:tetratricopeptide (TPR) repeat protein